MGVIPKSFNIYTVAERGKRLKPPSETFPTKTNLVVVLRNSCNFVQLDTVLNQGEKILSAVESKFPVNFLIGEGKVETGYFYSLVTLEHPQPWNK